MILAAGSGTRLRPLTSTVPKGMVSVAGKPVLAHAIEHLRQYGVSTIVINLHHLPDVIRDYFRDGRRWGVSITYSVEDIPLGTAGAVAKMRDRLTDTFFVWYGDNISTCRLDRLAAFHRSKGGIASLALFHRNDTTSSGVAELDGTDRITRFLEKPAVDDTSSRWVNAGIYLLEPDVLTSIPRAAPSDFGRHVFPAMLAAGRSIYGYRMGTDEGLWWIDTPGDLEKVAHSLSGPVR
jgi:NDP-sugar pyrophosphorylase family protein